MSVHTTKSKTYILLVFNSPLWTAESTMLRLWSRLGTQGQVSIIINNHPNIAADYLFPGLLDDQFIRVSFVDPLQRRYKRFRTPSKSIPDSQHTHWTRIRWSFYCFLFNYLSFPLPRLSVWHLEFHSL